MIAMPKLIPAEQRNALSLAITRGDTAQVQYLVEENGLDVDAFLDDSPTCMPVLMDALLSNGFSTETERLVLLRYLLEEGANPNICSHKGYNCLHVAVQQDKYIKALDLFLDSGADVNVPDADGANIVYWAVQGFLLRKEAVAEREEYLRVFGKILGLGADLDQKTRYDMNARQWLEHAVPEVRAMVTQWEEGKPVVTRVSTVQPRFPTPLQYPGVAAKIWGESGLAGGAATSVSGEMLRAVETLREEAARAADTRRASSSGWVIPTRGGAGAQPGGDARRGAGVGFGGGARARRQHKRMIGFVRDTLVKSGIFDKGAIALIRGGTDRLMRVSVPYTADDLYDQLVDAICVYYVRKVGTAAGGAGMRAADRAGAEMSAAGGKTVPVMERSL